MGTLVARRHSHFIKVLFGFPIYFFGSDRCTISPQHCACPSAQGNRHSRTPKRYSASAEAHTNNTFGNSRSARRCAIRPAIWRDHLNATAHASQPFTVAGIAQGDLPVGKVIPTPLSAHRSLYSDKHSARSLACWLSHPGAAFTAWTPLHRRPLFRHNGKTQGSASGIRRLTCWLSHPDTMANSMRSLEIC